MIELVYYRQDAAKWQTAGIKFTHRPKIRFFGLQGRLVAPIHVKLGRADGHLGPLGCAKFHLNRPRVVGMRPPKYQKFPLFGKESPRSLTILR